MSALHVFFATTCFLSLVLNLILLPWFYRFKYVPGLSILFWLITASFFYGLNAVAFDNDKLLVIPAYCDIG